MLQEMHAKPQLSPLLSMKEKEFESSSDRTAQIPASYQQKQSLLSEKNQNNYNHPFRLCVFGSS